MAKVMLKVKKDPGKGGTLVAGSANKNQYDQTADLRDAINNLVGYGYSDLILPEAKGNYNTLQNILGNDAAQKLFTKIVIHNKRPDLLKSQPLERLNSFYNVGANDQEFGGLLGKIKSFGHGVSGDIYDSPNVGNRVLVGNTKLNNEKSGVHMNTIPIMLGKQTIPEDIGYQEALNRVQSNSSSQGDRGRKVLLRVSK